MTTPCRVLSCHVIYDVSFQVAESSGDSDCLDEAQIFADGLTKQPSGPERGFQGTALMRGGSSSSATTSRRPSPPPAPALGSGGGSSGGRTVDVEAELAAAAALEERAGAGGIAELSDPILVCKLCTFHNKITAIHCGTCKGDLYPS